VLISKSGLTDRRGARIQLAETLRGPTLSAAGQDNDELRRWPFLAKTAATTTCGGRSCGGAWHRGTCDLQDPFNSSSDRDILLGNPVEQLCSIGRSRRPYGKAAVVRLKFSPCVCRRTRRPIACHRRRPITDQPHVDSGSESPPACGSPLQQGFHGQALPPEERLYEGWNAGLNAGQPATIYAACRTPPNYFTMRVLTVRRPAKVSNLMNCARGRAKQMEASHNTPGRSDRRRPVVDDDGRLEELGRVLSKASWLPPARRRLAALQLLVTATAPGRRDRFRMPELTAWVRRTAEPLATPNCRDHLRSGNAGFDERWRRSGSAHGHADQAVMDAPGAGGEIRELAGRCACASIHAPHKPTSAAKARGLRTRDRARKRAALAS